jgi:hypothetical protein
MAANVVHFLKRADRSSDWTQQELAQFYRARAALVRSGIAVEAERGLSDEGDPWFIFCRAGTDDVVVHFARCDGTYVIASPGIEQSARGPNVAALIEALIERHAPFVTVVKGERRSVVLHPSALLFALVVTCLFKLDQSQALAAQANRQSEGPPHTPLANAAIQTETAPNTLPVDADSGDSRLVAAFAAAIGSALTFEQWQDATSGVGATLPELAEADFPAAGNTHTTLQDAYAEGLLAPSAASSHLSVLASNSLPQDMTSLSPGDSLPGKDLTPHRSLALSQAIENESNHLAWTADNHSGLPYLDGNSSVSALNVPQASTLVKFDAIIADAAGQFSHSDALQDVLNVIGGVVRSNEVFDYSSGESQLILHLVEEENEHAATSNAGSVFAVVGSETQLAPPHQIASSPPSAVAAPVASAPPAPVASRGSATETQPSSGFATEAQVEQAINIFVGEHPDFQLIDANKEIVLFDPHINLENASHAQISSFLFSDGSSVVLVGLGHGFP